jgi:hypothetical protein
MERRTILTALAAAPLAALASTAHALGRRRRQCYDQSSSYVTGASAGVSKGLRNPGLTLTPETSGMMSTYTVVITADVSAENDPSAIVESIDSVTATLKDSGTVVLGFEEVILNPDNTVTLAAPWKRYKYQQTGVMLTAGDTYRASVTATLTERQFGTSPGVAAQ